MTGRLRSLWLVRITDGDPLNPHGDAAALGEFAMALRPRGHLYLGVPVGAQGRTSAGCRFYDEARFANLTDGWR